MQERLLQYLWQFQHFNKSSLTTVKGEALQIISPGSFNTNQGPDFLLAKIKIGTTTWAGNIELHINASHWNLHKHSADNNYANVILHVVWEYDLEIEDVGKTILPALELQSRVANLLLSRYAALMNSSLFVPRENQIRQVSALTLNSWKERLLVERLQKKAAVILACLGQNNFHWEEMFWRMLAKNFGTKINGEAFGEIASSLSLNILAKHKHQIHQLEALLFGQGGMLQEGFKEAYPAMLKNEYTFLAKKYNLVAPGVKLFFLRMRPANFPTIRLAQLAMLINCSDRLFSKVKDAASLEEIKKLLNVTANDYWHYHYMFEEPSSFKKKHLGEQMADNIIINTIVPVLFAYGEYNRQQVYTTKAINWLEEIDAEKNVITKGFEVLGIENKNAFDSQSLLTLKSQYCDTKRCLDCAVGDAILKSPFKLPLPEQSVYLTV